MLFEVGGNEGLAPSNLLALSFLAGSIVAHLTRGVVGKVFSVTVRAGDGVGAGGSPVLPVLLVDV